MSDEIHPSDVSSYALNAAGPPKCPATDQARRAGDCAPAAAMDHASAPIRLRLGMPKRIKCARRLSGTTGADKSKEAYLGSYVRQSALSADGPTTMAGA